MANLGKKNGVFLARFRHAGKEYKKSLGTRVKGEAQAALHELEAVLYRLERGWLRAPEGVDPGDFIVSGGRLQAPAGEEKPRVVPELNVAIAEFRDHLGHLAESNRYTIGVHLRHLQKQLADKTGAGIDQVTHQDLDRFLEARLKIRSPSTVRKERDTIATFFDWAVRRNYLAISPAEGLRTIKAQADLPPFRTLKEIEAIIQRGGLEDSEVLALWDTVYLNPEEIAGLLKLVQARCSAEVSFILHAIPGYTGMRRGEVLRLRWWDIEFEQDSLIARSKKQSRQVAETTRRIDLHPELKEFLLTWRSKRPRGQFVASDADSVEPLAPHQANNRFWQPLRGTSWCLNNQKNWFKIGFHSYRHSFASNLAARSIDQRLIDEFMGHQTEAMRKRYRHLFPKDRRSAIECFSLASAAATGKSSSA